MPLPDATYVVRAKDSLDVRRHEYCRSQSSSMSSAADSTSASGFVFFFFFFFFFSFFSFSDFNFLLWGTVEDSGDPSALRLRGLANGCICEQDVSVR